jgi:hypothetical protein
VLTDAYRFHQTKAAVHPVAWQIVYMYREKAAGAMIAITAVGQRHHCRAAVGADKTGIFCFPAHTEPPDI